LHVPPRSGTESWRDALSAYVTDPTSKSHASPVLRHNANSVTIKDIWPKATIHLLVLPRSQAKARLHPFTAFEDPTFLDLVRAECVQAKKLAADELRSKFGKYSAADKWPGGRDWAAAIKVGVHAVPTMSNLHIHVMSKELCGGKEPKHAERYNSFYSPFFVPLEDFPLAANDPRRWPERQGYTKQELECWKCKGKFGNDFEKLKKHLDVELENFKRE
jgi:aprataxin